MSDENEAAQAGEADAPITAAELAQAMRDRSRTYLFLSNALLHEFTAEQIKRLHEAQAPQGASPEVAEGFAKIHRYLNRAGADPRTDLAVDYARVFLSAGVYDGRTAEPYESAFTSPDHLLYQESRDDAMRVYRENGFAIDPKLNMPEDHLGIELEFLGEMAAKTAEAIEADAPDAEVARLAQVQADFIDKHILNWVDELIEKVDQFAKLPLYPALMRIVRAYARDDEELMRELAGALAAE